MVKSQARRTLTDVPLSEHFKLSELVKTNQQSYKLINMVSLLSNEKARSNLLLLCEQLLEPIRKKFGKPVIVHSGYRCETLNKEVKGSSNSQHLYGEACDFHVSGIDKTLVFDWIANDTPLKWGQLIDEPSWIHISLPNVRRRGEVKVARYNPEADKIIYTLMANGVNFNQT